MPSFLNTIYQNNTNRRIFEYTLASCVALTVGNFAVGGDNFPLMATIVGAMVISYFYPILLILTHFLANVLPMTLAKCFDDQRTWGIMFDQIGIGDLVYGIMLVTLLVRTIAGGAFFLLRRTSVTTDLKLGGLLLGLCLWFIYGILRNFDIYGLSAPGEFRNHYIHIIVPIYIAIFFDSAPRRNLLFKFTLLSCLWFPLLCVPVIGMVKGWGIGAESRFFPAEISFGLLQGIFFCFLGNRSGCLKVPGLALWFSGLGASIMIIIDTHRSVWVPAVVMSLAYIWLTQKGIRVGFEKILGFLGLGIITIYLASMIVSAQLDQGLTEFFKERGRDAFIIDTDYESTWTWRIRRWKMELEKLETAPLTGVGFGAYWGDPDSLVRDPVFPHNLYVQILVKLGIIGFLLYGAVVLRIFQKLWQGIMGQRGYRDPERPLLLAGLIALIGSHVHYLAYSFDPFSLFFIGLAMAVVQARHAVPIP